ncbi:MAG: hypothetical protein ACRYE8_01465 [Janthinobacterium lividum]
MCKQILIVANISSCHPVDELQEALLRGSVFQLSFPRGLFSPVIP